MTRKVNKSDGPSWERRGRQDPQELLDLEIQKVIEGLRPEVLRNGEKRNDLLEAALHLFEHYGYKKTTVDEIAREAGVAKGTVYLYFRDKREIIVSIINEKISSIFAEVAESIRVEPDVPSKMLRAIRIVLDRHLNDEAVNRILSRDFEFLGPLIFREIVFFENHLIKFLSVLLSLGVHEGSIRSDIDIETTARMIMRFNEANILRIKTGERVDIDRYIEALKKIVFEGIQSRGRGQ